MTGDTLARFLGDPVVTAFLIVVSPFVGSFLDLLATRMPTGRNWIAGRSACESCGATLAVRDLVPFAGFALNRGRCRHCGGTIPWRHPATEAAALAVAVVAVLAAGGGVEAWLAALLGWGLLALAAIDLEHGLLPNRLTLPLAVAGLAAAGLTGRPDIVGVLVGAAAGFLVFAVIGVAYRRLRGRDGLGLGDAKLLAAGGAWCGWQALPAIVFVGALATLAAVALLALVGRGRFDMATRIPFGPGLALAIWLVYLLGARIPVSASFG
ncbi:prepilin peptidase [Oceanibacterium hippocampi]|nr:A24 family peptidase [Oceanibacterium hippocampi]